MAKKISLSISTFAFAAFFLAVVSGLILAFQYAPFGNVFRNVEEITTVIPYGFFFRRFHYAAGHLFLILCLFHTVDHFVRKSHRDMGLKKWGFLTGLLLVTFFSVFTGFILKGDQEGAFAGTIMFNLICTIPWCGETIAGFFIKPDSHFFLLPYIHHVIVLNLIIIVLVYDHLRQILPGFKHVLPLAAGLALYALVVKMPLDIPPDARVASIQGPWFFIGIQGLLKILPPFFAGILLPTCLVLCFFVLPLVRGLPEKALRLLIVFGVVILAGFGLQGWWEHPGIMVFQ